MPYAVTTCASFGGAYTQARVSCDWSHGWADDVYPAELIQGDEFWVEGSNDVPIKATVWMQHIMPNVLEDSDEYVYVTVKLRRSDRIAYVERTKVGL